MSAFMVSERHLDFLATFARLHQISLTSYDLNSQLSDASAIALELATENWHSCADRYGKELFDKPVIRESTMPSRHDPVVVIKQAQCLRYQSCEHSGWESSQACRILDEIISTAISLLPGYEEAPWGLHP